MKTKIFSKELQLNNVPYERLVFDDEEVTDRYILLDDVNEKPWKITIKVFQALKISKVDCMDIDYRKGGDFPDDCFDDKEGYPVPQFRKHIMEVENSKWIKQLKKVLAKYHPSDDFMDKAKHFFIPCYDNVIEIIAWDIELEKVKENN